MLNKIRDFYYNIEDAVPTVLAVILTILFTALGLGLVFGIYCFLGWILMLVWGAIAAAFGLPVFDFWVYVGIVVLLKAIQKKVKVEVDKN